MSSLNEDGVISALELKKQLKATFGCAGKGSMNIAELYKLLENLIAIHARYEDDRKDKGIASDFSYPCSKGTATGQCSSPSIEKTNNQSEDSLSGKTETEETGLLERSKNTSREEISAEIKDIELPTPHISKEDGEKIDVRFDDEDLSAKGQEREMLPRNDKLESSKRVDAGPRTSIPSSSTSTSQRSSDFNVKSTSSMSAGSSLRKCNEEYFGDRETIKQLEPSVNLNVDNPVSDNTLDGSQENDCSNKLNLPLETTEISPKDGFHYSLPDLVAIMKGCKKHLESVKLEVLALKIRCQSQYDDTLAKLSGALDDLAKRFRDQEPKVSKLEKDMHCLGMLVSDYEWNFSSIKKGIDRNDAKAKDFERLLQRSDKALNVISGELRTVSDQMNYLSNEKADKSVVQMGLDHRALITDLLKHVTYEEFNSGFRELTNFVTQVREEQYALEETMKTVQYELVKGLDAKASTQDVCQIRNQLVGVFGRWQRAQSSAIGDSTTQLIRGNFRSAAVTLPGSMSQNTASTTCLTCGVHTILEGDNSVVPVGVKLTPAWTAKNYTRNAGGFHTTSTPPERVFRNGNLSMVQKMLTKNSSRKTGV